LCRTTGNQGPPLSRRAPDHRSSQATVAAWNLSVGHVPCQRLGETL
jgi:hypothetical protein